MTDRANSSQVGYGNPPTSTRFRKGQSGNPRGRPRNRRRDIPYDHVLGQMVTIREDGRERRVTAAEAFLLHITRRGMEGDSASARASLAAIEEARARRQSEEPVATRLIWKSVSPGGVGCALDALGIAHKVHKHSEQAKYLLNGWLIQVALGRLGDRRLSVEEQTIIVRATRTPQNVDWPDWWEVQS